MGLMSEPARVPPPQDPIPPQLAAALVETRLVLAQSHEVRRLLVRAGIERRKKPRARDRGTGG